jgi:hypothetical protein
MIENLETPDDRFLIDNQESSIINLPQLQRRQREQREHQRCNPKSHNNFRF